MKKFKSFVSVIAFCVVPGVFGMHEGGQVSNTESVVEGVESILRCIQTVDANVRRNENVQQVVLLGATGAGKTSLLHALARTKVKAASGDGAARLANRFSLVPAEEAVEAIGRVDGGGRSVTSDIRPCPIGNVLYCDCPGFFDTHGVYSPIL